MSLKTETSPQIEYDEATANKKLIGRRLRLARELRGMSQEVLAHSVDVSQDAISAYERGVRGIQSAELPLFAKALNVPVSFFYGDIYPADELNDLYNLLPEQARRLLIEYAYLVKKEFTEG